MHLQPAEVILTWFDIGDQDENSEQESGVLEIKNARLKKHYFKDSTQKYMYGFVVMAKRKTIEFYVDNLEEREAWVDKLKQFVILLDLKEEFVIGRLLGRGNFAKVHICHRKSDMTKQYALKTMQKSFVQKNKRNIVSESLSLVSERQNSDSKRRSLSPSCPNQDSDLFQLNGVLTVLFRGSANGANGD